MRTHFDDRTGRCALNKKSPRNLATVLVLGLSLAGGGWAMAGSFQVLHTFAGSDGAQPFAWPTVVDGTIYGTTHNGGPYEGGVLFKMNADGSGYTALKSWAFDNGDCLPWGAALVSGTTIYGTTAGWIPTDYYGSVFKVNTDGSGYTPLRLFGGSEGAQPTGNLVLVGTTLYGTTTYGGLSNRGTIFRLNTDGSGFAIIHDFASSNVYAPSGLALSGTTLFGGAAGGPFNGGVIYQIQTDGSFFTIMKSFLGSDGSQPGPLLVSGGMIYGTYGDVVFKIGTTGGAFTTIKYFSGPDGRQPNGSLVLAGNALYGATLSGGGASAGNVYKVSTDGSGFVVLKEFQRTDGERPQGLDLYGTTLFGTTRWGGDANWGVVFAISIAPPGIQKQTPSQTAEIGRSVSFRVDATGFDPLSYQWYFNETNLLSGRTDRILTLANVQPSHAGVYKVVVTDYLGQSSTASAPLQVVTLVERKLVPGMQLAADPGSVLNVEYAGNPVSTLPWTTLDTVIMSNGSQSYFDLSLPLPSRRFYRLSQSTNPGQAPVINLFGMVPAIKLTGAPGSSVRVDGINQFGPTDAWFTLDTVTLTNTSQLYFDILALTQPPRFYRLVPIP